MPKVLPLKIICWLILAVLTPASAFADGVTNTTNFAAILQSTPSAEMPARAAELVVQADATNRLQTSIGVVKSAVGLNPAAVLAVVGSIAESAPVTAATVAETAAALEPDSARSIARAAAASVPAAAGAIVEAVCRVNPADYQGIGLAVARVAPGLDGQILAGVAAGIPELKWEIEEKLAGYRGLEFTAGMVLAEVAASECSQQYLKSMAQSRRHSLAGRGRSLAALMDSAAGEGGSFGLEGVFQPQDFSRP